MPHLAVIQGTGAPVERRLARAGLPCTDTASSGAYLPLLRAVDFLDTCAREEGIDDLALRGALASRKPALDPRFDRALNASSTLHGAMRALCSLAALEAPCIDWRIEFGRATVRVSSRLAPQHPGAAKRYCEWYANVALITVMRSFATSSWCPSELTFESAAPVSELARERFPDTRLRTGAPRTGIEFPRRMLTLRRRSPSRFAPMHPGAPLPAPPVLDFLDTLKLLLETFLPDQKVSVGLAAELANTSVRTLQRRLRDAGISYSDLLQRARFEAAARLLEDSDEKIIDVAFQLGWSDPSHFSRAFRRATGMSPREYRAQKAA